MKNLPVMRKNTETRIRGHQVLTIFVVIPTKSYLSYYYPALKHVYLTPVVLFIVCSLFYQTLGYQCPLPATPPTSGSDDEEGLRPSRRRRAAAAAASFQRRYDNVTTRRRRNNAAEKPSALYPRTPGRWQELDSVYNDSE